MSCANGDTRPLEHLDASLSVSSLSNSVSSPVVLVRHTQSWMEPDIHRPQSMHMLAILGVPLRDACGDGVPPCCSPACGGVAWPEEPFGRGNARGVRLSSVPASDFTTASTSCIKALSTLVGGVGGMGRGGVGACAPRRGLLFFFWCETAAVWSRSITEGSVVGSGGTMGLSAMSLSSNFSGKEVDAAGRGRERALRMRCAAPHADVVAVSALRACAVCRGCAVWRCSHIPLGDAEASGVEYPDAGYALGCKAEDMGAAVLLPAGNMEQNLLMLFWGSGVRPLLCVGCGGALPVCIVCVCV